MKYSVELSEFNVIYQSRITIRVQAPADFVAKYTGVNKNADSRKMMEEKCLGRVWTVIMDGTYKEQEVEA